MSFLRDPLSAPLAVVSVFCDNCTLWNLSILTRQGKDSIKLSLCYRTHIVHVWNGQIHYLFRVRLLNSEHPRQIAAFSQPVCQCDDYVVVCLAAAVCQVNWGCLGASARWRLVPFLRISKGSGLNVSLNKY